jgi:hypothetical protein
VSRSVPWALEWRPDSGWSSRWLRRAVLALAVLSFDACSDDDPSSEAQGQDASAELADQAIVFTALVGEGAELQVNEPGRRQGRPADPGRGEGRG